ncbi:hypothetical protein Dimus_016367 [Dionaea muscipula]
MAAQQLAFSLLLLLLCFSFPLLSHQQATSLDSTEQESVYAALESINSVIPWRTLFPDDLCLSAPHGVVCDYFTADAGNTTSGSAHVVELSFGFVSDYTPNPPCLPNSTFPYSLNSLPRLMRLFFYRCFTENPVTFPDFGSGSFRLSALEELVLMDNPALVGSINGTVANLAGLRRLILSGSNVTGRIPEEIGNLRNLEQLTISGNLLKGEMPLSLRQLKKLRLLDLSHNGLEGIVPESIGQMGMLLKLDLSSNNLVGKIPESLKGLQMLEFMDVGFNRFGNFGIPLFLGEMPKLKEVYLSGNNLGGAIPEIWENLGGIMGIGLSGVGLVGKIPGSMGLFLRNVVYIGLDNNKLEGTVPKEFELMGSLHELNLQNNQLSGRVPFTAAFAAGIGTKLKLEGNPDLCMEEGFLVSDKHIGPSMRSLKFCSNESEVSIPALANTGSSLELSWSWHWMVLLLGGSFCLLLHFLLL